MIDTENIIKTEFILINNYLALSESQTVIFTNPATDIYTSWEYCDNFVKISPSLLVKKYN